MSARASCMKSSPSYPKGIYQWMDPSILALPPVKGSAGFDSAPRNIRRPGDNDWDISIFKNIPLWRETTKLQLRVEMFNAFNHARFNDFNRSAQFNAAGQLVEHSERAGWDRRAVRVRSAHGHGRSATDSAGGEVLFLRERQRKLRPPAVHVGRERRARSARI